MLELRLSAGGGGIAPGNSFSHCVNFQQGNEVAAPMIGAGLGTLGGATIGKGVEKLQATIPQFTIPKITGGVAESAGSEYLGDFAQSLAEKVQKKLEKKSDAK
ncbi:hypothetical protein [Pantoea ananatis]|uniref:hypothetical protein n=3 Tax=Pantoea ananas TaxID=553 RepID=UPI001B30FEE0|nr:hypothetical protein [Pantoea ananatis]